jgi:hypothetical protein
MAYSVTVKSTHLTQDEGQNSGYDPLTAKERGGKLRVAAYSYTRSAELEVGNTVGLCIIPKGCVVVGIVSRFIKATNNSALSFGTLSISTGSVATGGASTPIVHTGLTADYEAYVFVVNPNVFTATTEDCVVHATIETANTGSNPAISGYVLYVVD